MPNSESFSAEMQFLVWREEQMAAITRQLQQEFPDLVGRLRELIFDTDTKKILMLSAGFKSSVSALIESWKQEQLVRAMSRAEGALEKAIALVSVPRCRSDGAWTETSDLLANVVKGGVVAASLASVPVLLSFATVSGGGVLGLFTVTTLFWPALIAGIAGLAVAALFGVRAVDGLAKLRTRVAANTTEDAARVTFGIGQKRGAPCILSDIQAAVLQAGLNRLKAL